MELYFRPMACSLACRIALIQAGGDVRYREVDFATKRTADDAADFLTISAKGRVPVLILDDGQTLTENAAVLQYIADLYPCAALAPPPADPERYRLQEWLSFISTEIHKAFLYPAFRMDTPEEVRAHARVQAPHSLAVAAARLEQGPYLLGERFSVADAYLVWALLLARFAGVDLGVTLTGYLERMQQRAAVRDAIAIERGLMQVAPTR